MRATRRRTRRVRRAAGAAGLALALAVLAGCGGSDEAVAPLDRSDWSAVLAQAQGQTVHWYYYGGDDVLNTFVSDEVAPRLEALGVTLDPVRVADTADAVDKVLGQRQAGLTSGGAVDAIWINGENFATGRQADLWWCGWAEDLPNAQYVDLDAPGVASDFGVPVEGCESVWQQASSALVYDSAQLDADDVASVDALLAWVRAHPGRFTYPAPPDFTGSMAVRSLLYGELGGPGPLAGAFDQTAYEQATASFFPLLNALEPSLWREGQTYPTSQDDVEKLYADGEIAAFFTYGPGAVAAKVAQGTYPDTTREAVPASGNIANDSFVTIPADAEHRAGALVLTNMLQEPEVQLALYEAEGAYPGIDVSRLPAAAQQRFAAVQQSPSTLSLAALRANAQPELASAYLSRIEDDWRTKVLQQ